MLHILCGMTALLSGRFEEAVRASEIACALPPTYRPPQRSLVPLYFVLASVARRAMHSRGCVGLEPNFSLDVKRNTSYPGSGIRASGLLSSSDGDL
jgi:hypothetical protein